MIAFLPSQAVAVELFGFSVYWYGLLYFVSFLNGLWMLQSLQHYRLLVLSKEQWRALVSWLVITVIVGGRLGYALLYEASYFVNHPLRIFFIRDGGMAFHGGFLGVVIAIIFYSRRNHVPFLPFVDTLVVPVAIGLALGRAGNLLNQELYGTITTLPWGMYVGGAHGLRHPLPIYGMIKDIAIACVCFWDLRKTPVRPGSTSGTFLALYGILRFLLEYVREQHQSVFTLNAIMLTRGQLYCIPMIIAGVVLLYMIRTKRSYALPKTRGSV